MFRRFSENYNADSNDMEVEGDSIVGKTMGCGCCSDEVPLTIENLDEHIKDLKFQLDLAKCIKQGLVALFAAKANQDTDEVKRIRSVILEMVRSSYF